MLELNHVGYTTEDGMEILHDITLKIDERFVAVTGPNGGGKSTLAKVIAGIYQPTKGSILLDGVDITNMSITDRAKEGISFALNQRQELIFGVSRTLLRCLKKCMKLIMEVS